MLNDVVRFKFEFFIYQRVFGFTFYMRETSDVPDQTTCIEAANNAGSFYQSTIEDCLSVDVRLQSVYCTRVLPGPAIPGRTPFDDTKGNRLGNSYPANSPILFRISSDDPGVKRAGRIYLSGISETDVSGGQLVALFLSTQVEALRAKLQTGINTGTWQGVLGILRTVNLGLPLVPPQFFPVSTVSAFPQIFSQRRRNSKQTAIVG